MFVCFCLPAAILCAFLLSVPSCDDLDQLLKSSEQPKQTRMISVLVTSCFLTNALKLSGLKQPLFYLSMIIMCRRGSPVLAGAHSCDCIWFEAQLGAGKPAPPAIFASWPQSLSHSTWALHFVFSWALDHSSMETQRYWEDKRSSLQAFIRVRSGTRTASLPTHSTLLKQVTGWAWFQSRVRTRGVRGAGLAFHSIYHSLF